MSDLCTLDTDTLSEVLKNQNQDVVANAAAYLREHGEFAISGMVHFEIVRGLRAIQAAAKLAAFDQLCQTMTIYPVTADVLDRAADLWATGKQLGKPRTDADVIIAATALVHGLELVTGNVDHFNWISGLTVSSWRK
jgi:tRNA(fMet)-specific endonuclease VapC